MKSTAVLFLLIFALSHPALADRELPLPLGEGPVDIATGAPQVPSNKEDVPRLTPELVEEMKAWRNDYGRPWSTWGYEKEQTFETKYLHSMRYNIGDLLGSLEVGDLLDSFVLSQFGIDWTPPKLGWGLPDGITYRDVGKWYQERVSGLAATNVEYALADCFAWYTSPDYEPGSLPGELEAVLEKMTRAEHPGADYIRARLGEDNVRSLIDTLAKLRAGAYPRDEIPENPPTGLDVYRFLVWKREHKE